jgi:hypothetical protein
MNQKNKWTIIFNISLIFLIGIIGYFVSYKTRNNDLFVKSFLSFAALYYIYRKAFCPNGRESMPLGYEYLHLREIIYFFFLSTVVFSATFQLSNLAGELMKFIKSFDLKSITTFFNH